MRSYNKAIFIGNLAAEPELRQTKKGTAVASFPLATNRSWNDADGNTQTDVDYHRITCWGALAKIAKEHLTKGSAIAVDGRITNRVYENSKGEKVFVTEMIADSLNILNWKKSETATKPTKARAKAAA